MAMHGHICENSSCPFLLKERRRYHWHHDPECINTGSDEGDTLAYEKAHLCLHCGKDQRKGIFPPAFSGDNWGENNIDCGSYRPLTKEEKEKRDALEGLLLMAKVLGIEPEKLGITLL